MNNNIYLEKAQHYIEEIEECIKRAKNIARGVIGDNLLDIDLCFCGLLDRSIRLADGFIPMVKNRNLTCAGALLRLQLDNCLRLYALYIADDEGAVVTALLNGDKIDKLKDKKGNQMRDTYLKNELGNIDSQLPIVYENTSGFIHFSAKAIYQSIYDCNDHTIKFQVGGELNEKRNETLIECAAAYLHFYRLFLEIMKSEADWKKDFDKGMEE